MSTANAERSTGNSDGENRPASRLGSIAAPAFVAVVWVWMLVMLVSFVRTYGSRIPFLDDIEMVPGLLPTAKITWRWLWSQHNEHRIVIPRLVYLAIMKLASNDFRSGMMLQVIGVSSVALAMILMARRLRGHTTYSDAFFPLIWMHLGNYANLLLGFQIAVFLPTFFVCCALLTVLARAEPMTWRRILLAGAFILALPLCGGSGMAQAPPLLAFLALSGVAALRSRAPGARRDGIMSLSIAVAGSALFAYYFVDFEFPEYNSHASGVGEMLLTAAQFMSLCLTPAAYEFWPVAGGFVAVTGVATFILLGWVIARDAHQRPRATGLAFGLLTIVSLALSIGWGRAGADVGVGFADRYVTMPAPLLCCAYFAWTLYGPRAIGRLVRVSLYSVQLLLVMFNASQGNYSGALHQVKASSFEQSLRAGLSIEALAATHWKGLYVGPKAFAARLHMMQDANLPPFCDVDVKPAPSPPPPEPPEILIQKDPLDRLDPRPSQVISPIPLMLRRKADKLLIMAKPETEIHYSLAPGPHRVSGEFGMLSSSWKPGTSDGVTFTIELRASAEELIVLGERTLDPRQNFGDRGPQVFSFPVPAGDERELVLRTSNLPGRTRDMDFAFWTGIRIE